MTEAKPAPQGGVDSETTRYDGTPYVTSEDVSTGDDIDFGRTTEPAGASDPELANTTVSLVRPRTPFVSQLSRANYARTRETRMERNTL